MVILQNQRVIHQQLLDIQHKHEALEKRLTNIIEKSDWYKVSISFNGMGWVESKRTFKLDRKNNQNATSKLVLIGVTVILIFDFFFYKKFY